MSLVAVVATSYLRAEASLCVASQAHACRSKHGRPVVIGWLIVIMVHCPGALCRQAAACVDVWNSAAPEHVRLDVLCAG